MPSAPRRRRRQQAAERLAELSKDQVRDLATGRPFFGGFHTREEFEDMWAAVGDELLAEWLDRHPGLRPFGWWVCEHKRERPVVHEITGNGVARLRAESRFGFLHSSIWLGGLTPLQMDETDYLQSLGLLSDEELARIPLEDDDDDSVDLGIRISQRMGQGPRREG